MDKRWIADELRLWNEMMDPRALQIWARKPNGSIDRYKESRRPNGQLRKKRERKGKPVPASEAVKVAESQRLYRAWINH